MPCATPNHVPPRIVLGVSGGIAAYKSVEILRRMRDAGYFVSPILTPDATRFVGAVTFSALASEPARVSLYGDPTTPIPHTYLGQNADLIVVVPATAHLIARYAMGLGDDLLTATLLAARAPVLLCPAMHTEMWEQPSVQENLATLRRRGVMVLEPEVGRLAGGDEGAGRLPEPEVIVTMVQRILEGYRGILSGRRVLVSAGGTHEAIDPVRVVTNRSSGHQGHALAEVAARLGAHVTLVSTATREVALDVRRVIRVIHVESAAQMARAMFDNFASCDVAIMAAAVADFTFDAAPKKLKKEKGLPVLTPVATTDIVSELAARRTGGQIVVAFAAETEDLEARAIDKLERKGVDLVVANDVSQPLTGFASPTNEVLLVSRGPLVERISLRSKEGISEKILTKVASLFNQGVA
ncbi:MAG: bifunctional phosphopantothenoylcysteine decarboxylase/phosphopantothenate--cysteine ligase CoaBC [Acidimicrobiaceae bacterium]|nr:bifunctional phosphopantothenoylcysteine decarboxylase/phosphopantothenate--cysteine ligase CoaBC [Acidimicrobiaceae bacterium]